MKKILSIALCCLLLCALAASVMAASDGPVITLQPQSPTYTQYDVALYIVKAEGTNLTATWYLDWLGETYNISDTSGAMQDWEPYAGETYGPQQPDANTFTYTFGGIEYDLDGAYIWCVIEDGHNTVTSQKVRVSVKDFGAPPQHSGDPRSGDGGAGCRGGNPLRGYISGRGCPADLPVV